MKKEIICLLLCSFVFQSIGAENNLKWVEKARKAVFSIITYDKDDQILNTGNGFYIDNSGTAVSDYTLFKNANRAVIITTEGKELPVNSIMGANDLYDIVKFNVDFEKKSTFLPPSTLTPKVGDTVYLLPYSTQKSAEVTKGTILKLDTIDNKSYYYTLNLPTTDKTVSCPIMNAQGELLGLIQKSAEGDSTSYAIGINYAEALAINAVSINNLALQSIGIKKSIPDDESQALGLLFLASSQFDKQSYAGLLNDFIAKFPKSLEGYLQRATYYINIGNETNYALAKKDMETILKIADDKSEAHYDVAKLIYNYQLTLQDSIVYEDWTFERALNEINEAIKERQEPLYVQLKGDIYFAMQNYAEAYLAYDAVNKTSLASASTFYSAAKAKELTEGSDKKEVIALLDSTIARFKKPYGQDVAPYLYERARVKNDIGEYKEAVLDYNAFYDAMPGQVSAEFHFTRMQAEVQCRMYQQALNDINKAVELDPRNVVYWVEKGSLHLRVNQLDEAVKTLETAIKIDTENAPAYRMLGYTLVQQNQTDKGIVYLEKAKELGDEVATSLLQKYKK